MMPAVGRKKWVWHDLPPRMKARKLVSGRVLYYYQAAGKQIPLGPNRLKANDEWARLEAGGTVQEKRFQHLTADYRLTFDALAKSTRDHYRTALNNLDVAFKNFALEQIAPKHVKEYMRRRTKKGAARLERKVLSAFFTWARDNGHTSAPNPCVGVSFSKAERRAYGIQGERKVYVDDGAFADVYRRADDTIKDAMDLALLTGQRPSDLLRARRQDIQEGVLWIAQEKTGKRLGIKVEGELQSVLDRVLGRRRDVPSMYLLCDRRGQRLTYDAFYRRFLKAKGDAAWQFRDIRAKAASDSPDLKCAQQLLGHEKETTTTIYRRSRGDVVAPLDRKIQDGSKK
jgi:integrase